MKVALLTRDLPPVRVGGVASWVDDLAQALVADGRDVTVFAESRSVGEGRRPYRVVSVLGRSWAQWQGTWMAAALLRHGLRDGVVVAATWRLATALVGPMAPRVLLVGAHGSDVTALSSAPPGLRRLQDRAVFVPVSRFLCGRLETLGVGRVRPMPWPLPPPPPPRVAGRAEQLVCVSRLVPGKGLDDVIRLAAVLGRPLRVVGDGPAQSSAQDLAEKLGVAVSWRGACHRDVARAELAQAAAAVLLPDGPEGLGLCLLEAAAAGTPTIGRASGGTPEAVGPGVVLPAGVPISELDLTAVHRLLSDPSAGVQARRWVDATHNRQLALRTFDAAVSQAQEERGCGS